MGYKCGGQAQVWIGLELDVRNSTKNKESDNKREIHL